MSLPLDERLALAGNAFADLGALVERVLGEGDAAELGAAAERGLRAVCAAYGDSVRFELDGDLLQVRGQLVDAGRAAWRAAHGLAQRLRSADVAALEVAAGVTRDDLLALARALGKPEIDDGALGALRLVRRDTPAARGGQRSEPARVLSAYAASLVALRNFHAALARGELGLPRAVKRAAQRLCAVEPGPAWLGLTTLAASHRDDAGRAVQTAVIGLAVARELTRDLSLLEPLALAALMTDSGRPLLTALGGDAQEASVPAATAAACLGSSPTDAAAWRASVTFEAAWLERQAVIGPLQRPPSIPAALLHLARAYLDCIAPRDGRAPLSPPDALREVGARADVDPDLFALLGRALGDLPPGTVVELTTGEWALVAGRSTSGDRTRPLVRVLTDPRGKAHARAIDLDLGGPISGTPAPGITGVIAPARARFNTAQTFFGASR